MNRHLTTDPGEFRPADRYYGRVDSVEVIDNQNSETLVQLDAVAADAFDATPFEDRPLNEPIDRLPLAVIEISTPRVEKVQPGEWLEIRNAPPSVPVVTADYYPGLFSAGVTLPSEIKLVAKDFALRLSKAFSMDDIPDETEQWIASRLSRVSPADFITVFDVGQGNLNALWESSRGAVLYFDFGGAVTANTQTYPKQPLTPCFTSAPPVVLSHWDWDHWSSAGRFPKALDLDWIVPRCTDPGAHHRALAWELHRRGHLHIWPDAMTDYVGPYFCVEKCTGYGRNDSGLAMTVHGESQSDFDGDVLLTGDAAYDCIPQVQRKSQFRALVASHHGASVNSIDQVCPSMPDSSLVYSVGNGNAFCHPRLHAELEYLRNRWAPANTFSTSQRVRNRPNNIAIRLSSRPVSTGCGFCTPKLIG